MIRKITGISFFLLANVVLMMHTIIAHHHHGENICFATLHCSDDSASHKDDPGYTGHEHDGSKNLLSCVLDQVVTLTESKLKNEFIRESDSRDRIFHTDLTGIIKVNDFSNQIRFSATSPFRDYLSPPNSQYISFNPDLRAPPVL